MNRPEQPSVFEADADSPAFFKTLREKAENQVNRGHLEEALATCNQALAWAKEYGDRDACDLAFCGRAAVLIMRKEGQGVLGPLRQILMRSCNPSNQHLAAYYVSLYYDQLENYAKSTFYARLALHHANHTVREDLISHSCNRLANALIASSYFAEACEHYRRALELLPAEKSLKRAALLGNYGACLISLHKPREGLRFLLRSRRMFAMLKVDGSLTKKLLHTSSSFGYLQLGRPHQARLHAKEVLRLAETTGDNTLIKKALYLLGEAEKQAGDEIRANQCYSRLQSEFYPETPFLAEMLMRTETHQLINPWM